MKVFFQAFITLLGLLIIAAVGAVYYFDLPINASFFEKTKPTITAKVQPKALGTQENVFTYALLDKGAGLDEVVVTLDQNGVKKEVLKKKYDSITKTDEVTFSIQQKAFQLKEGDVRIDISVFDKSFWNNQEIASLILKSDFVKPRIEVLTVQHNGTVGGTLFTIYRLLGDDIKTSDVRDGKRSFPGYAASLLDKDFENFKDIYFSFFPIASDFDPRTDRLEVYAEDEAGNIAKNAFYQRIAPKKFKEVDMKMGRDFYKNAVDTLLPSYSKAAPETVTLGETASMSDEEIIAQFKLVNENYRGLLAGKLKEMNKNPLQERLWNGVFDRPMPAAPTATFMEKRFYFLNSLPAGSSIHQGVDLAQTAQALVRAPNGGKVIFADEFGIYGNAIILDHGFGITSMYGHLSTILVTQDQIVQKGDSIGRSGATGLAGGDHLHFEIRVHNIPVTPIEWFDAKWIKDHVDGQIKYVKDVFKITSATVEKK
jgi:murein DD-endopeptidase MepM/ murein hydrolase activator NlpD